MKLLMSALKKNLLITLPVSNTEPLQSCRTWLLTKIHTYFFT